MPESITSFFDSNTPHGKIHSCIFLGIVFLTLAVVQIILRFVRADAHSLEYILLGVSSAVIAVGLFAAAIYERKKLNSNNTDKHEV